jgi:hypothetical protein
MRPRVPASVAICAVLMMARASFGQDQPRRQVAVVDLSEDKAVEDLSASIYRALNVSDVLRVPDRRQFEQYLTGPLLDEDGGRIQSARNHRGLAENRLFVSYDSKDAATEAGYGEQDLQSVTPTDDVRALYAGLTLLEGLALLDRDPSGAARAFALTHRLDPATTLDPARYPPDIIDAFNRAAVDAPRSEKLTVHGTGRAWIDGQDRGDAPGTFDVERGDHYIVLTGVDRETTGVAVRVAGKTQVEISDAPAPPALQVQRTRLALSRAVTSHDDAARAGAIQELASLLGVGDVVMISKRPDGKLQYETWRDRAPGFSAPQMYTDQKPETLLEGLAPPVGAKATSDPATPSISIGKPMPGPEDTPWYERRWVQASAAAGVAAIIVGVILYARRGENVAINHDIMSGM